MVPGWNMVAPPCWKSGLMGVSTLRGKSTFGEVRECVIALAGKGEMRRTDDTWACLTAWTLWALCRARTNIVPKPRVSVSGAGLADIYLASPTHPRIRIGWGTIVAWILPAERPETCSRPPGVRHLRSAFGRVRRNRRAADAGGAPAAGRRIHPPARRHTSAFLACDASPPAPVTRPLRRRTPVRTLASPFLGRRAGAL